MSSTIQNGENFIQSRTVIVSFMVIVYMVMRVILFHFGLVDLDTLTKYSDIEFSIFAILTTISIFYVASKFEENTTNRKTMLYLGIGFLLWTLGEMFWGFYEIILEKDPFPSIADVFYIAGYFPVVYVLVYRAQSVVVPPESKRILGLFALLAIFYGISLYFVIYPILVSGEPTLDVVISIGYPLLDIFLLTAAFYLFAKYAGGKLERVWLLFSLSMILDAIADTLFAYEDWNDEYDALSWADDLFIASYLITIIFSSYLSDIYRNRTS